MRPHLSVVIPAYNEAGNIRAGALEKATTYLASQPYNYEILVVDDGSEDATVAAAEEFARAHPSLRVIRNPHRGKAYTVATGMLAAEGDLVLFTDMDQATPLSESEQLLPWMERGFDVVIGSRGTVRRHAPRWRKLMSRCQILLRNLILGFQGVTDTQCGFKAFRRESATDILRHLHLYGIDASREVRGATVTSGFDVEVLYVAEKLGYRIKEVPVEWDYQRTRRVNMLKDSLRGLRDLVRIRLADARGAYAGTAASRRTESKAVDATRAKEAKARD